MKRTEKDRLTGKEIEEKLPAFTGWSYDPKELRIEKTFDRNDFLGAAIFVQRIAFVAEKQDHHPDILLHGYKFVKVMLSTHSAGGVTQNDFDLALAINILAS
jgi:4a-hydroxytetrahydrobiopterin dehydratase